MTSRAAGSLWLAWALSWTGVPSAAAQPADATVAQAQTQADEAVEGEAESAAETETPGEEVGAGATATPDEAEEASTETPLPQPEPATAPPPAEPSEDPALSVGAQMEAADPAPVELTAAELAELGLTAADMEEKSVLMGTPLHFSGFADFSMLAFLAPEDNPWRTATNRFPAFFVGNFNLYMSKDLTRYLRMFSEVRFTFLPNGSVPSGSTNGEYVSTVADDYADFNRPLNWAGIEIERIYLEWTAHRLLTFRLGVFLTPYGIWNVDHGTPTIVPVQRPFVIGSELFPERQTGLEIYGSTDVGTNHTVGYHATLSNGLGPVSSYKDFDRNKAVGARAYWRYRRLGDLQLGGSLFYGMDTAATEVPGLDANGLLRFTQNISSQSRVLSLAADARWEWEGLLLQSEFITQQRAYTDEGRVGATNPLLGTFVAPVDRFSWGAYGLLGYRFDWYGVMPYAMFQATDLLPPDQVLMRVRAFTLGINIRPIPVLVVKVEYVEGHWPDGHVVSDKPVRFMQLQFAWAF